MNTGFELDHTPDPIAYQVWRTSKFENVSDNGITLTYKTESDSLGISTPTGPSYIAKLEGTDPPYKGDPGTNGVSLKRWGKNGFEETDKREREGDQRRAHNGGRRRRDHNHRPQ